MTDFIKKEQVNGSQKVVVGNKYNDLVLRTLGRVYVQTGSKFTLLTEYLDKVTNEKNGNASKILIWNNESELTEGKYPGDGYFIYIKETKDLYITFEGGYIPLILSGNSTVDWEALNKRFLSKSGGEVDNFIKVNGEVIAEKGKFYDQVEINGVKSPLKVTSKELVNNLNSEYLNGHSSDEVAIKNQDESILGQWKFNNITTFNDTVRYSNKLVNANGFAPGFTGYGWMLDSESCTLTIDNLIVRKLMQVYELVVNKISATNGSLWVSDSAKIKSSEYIDETIKTDESGNPILDNEGNKVYDHPLYESRESVDFDTTSSYPDNESTFPSTETDQNGNKLINVYKTQFTGDFYHIVLDEDYCPFRLNDLLRCQRFDGTNIKYYDAIVTNTLQSNEVIIRLSKSLNDTYNSVKSEVDDKGNVTTTVVNKPQNQFEEDGETEISSTTFDKSLTSPAEGDGLVRIGNTSIRDRMGAVYITSSDVGGPYIDVMNEVLTPNFNKITKYVDNGKNVNHKCLKVRLGNLNGIYDSDFIQQPHGYGLYADNVFLKGKFMQVNSSGSTSPIPIYRGEWKPGDTYSKGDQVTWGGEIYSALITSTNQEPPNSTFWELVVSKGEDGKPGADGKPGQDGIGASPVFYGEWDVEIKYPVSKVISSIVCITSGENKQYFKTKAQDGFGGQEFIQGISPIKNGSIQEPWESFGGDFQSIATGLLLAEEANIADWIIKDGKITSQDSITDNNNKVIPRAQLNGRTGEMDFASLVDKYQANTSTKNVQQTIKISSTQGRVEVRTSDYDTSYMTSQGMFSNRAGVSALPASTGIEVKGAIVGLGFGEMNADYWFGPGHTAAITGVFGRASNSAANPAPAYGGYFENLFVSGLVLRSRILSYSATLYASDTFVMGIPSSNITYTLPLNASTGQMIFIKNIGTGNIVVKPNTGQYLFDDSTANADYTFDNGRGGILTFFKEGISVNGTPSPIWVINQYKW